MADRKVITVADIDHLFSSYAVLIDERTEIGSKSSLQRLAGKPEFDGYYKSEYDRHGRDRGLTIDQRRYKGPPPWFKYEVLQVTTSRHGLSLLVKGPD